MSVIKKVIKLGYYDIMEYIALAFYRFEWGRKYT